MDATDIVLDFEPVVNRWIDFIEAAPVGVIDQFLLNGSHEPLCQAILSRLTGVGHADADVVLPQQVDIIRSGVLDALVGMENMRNASLERHA